MGLLLTGCSKPTCLNFPPGELSKFYDVDGVVDGFVTVSKRNEKSYDISDLTECDASYEATECFDDGEWLAGIVPETNTTASDHLSLRCCRNPVMKAAKFLNVVDITNNEIYEAGNVSIQEINEKVFKYYGYSMIKNSVVPILKKKVAQSCDEIFVSWQEIAEKGLTKNPPKEIPNPKEDFLLNGYATLSHYYFNETPNNSVESIKIWNQTYIDELIEMAKNNNPNFFLPYGKESLSINAAFKDFNIDGKIGAVIGSQTPWAEVFSLINGAKHVTTVDYQKIRIEHPQMDFIYAPSLPSLRDSLANFFTF